MMSYKLEMLEKILKEFKIELDDHIQIQETNPNELNDMCIKSYKKDIVSLENKIKELRGE